MAQKMISIPPLLYEELKLLKLQRALAKHEAMYSFADLIKDLLEVFKQNEVEE